MTGRVVVSTLNSYYTKTESDNWFYTKTYLDNVLNGKVDDNTLNSYYTKTAIDTTFTNYYSKSQIHNTFTNYYSKTYIETNLYNKTYIDALAKPQIKYSNVYVVLDKVEFEDSTLSLGTSSGEYKITSTPPMSNGQGLVTALSAKRNISDGYTKIEIDTNIYTKTQSDNLFFTKTHSDNVLNGKVDDNTLNWYYKKLQLILHLQMII